MKIAPTDFAPLENKRLCEPDKTARSPILSFVVPVYGSPESLQPRYERVQSIRTMMGLSELILVDDGCPHNSWAVVKQIAKIDHAVVGIQLSSQFWPSTL